MAIHPRRRFIIGAAGAALATACTTQHDRPPVDDIFRHGVASGDPAADSIVLWTRVSGYTRSVRVRWQLATDSDFSRLVATGQMMTDANSDHTVKVIPTGLTSGAIYYYRFGVDNQWSAVGRTRTLPQGAVEQLGIALASCSNFAFGYFNAYDAIAKDQSVDFVLHTGDYIYEYGAEGWGAETARRLGRVHSPTHEIVSLADYRQRHAQYKSDLGSQAMHAAHPMLSCWDDHESTNNPWVGGAQNHQSNEGSWSSRRRAATRAYYEWMPIREPEAGLRRIDYWRDYSFGDLATLITLETRHTARAEQIDYSHYAEQIKTAADAERFMQKIVGAQDRPMLSGAMNRALDQGLRRSIADGQPWRLIGNASPMARMLVPDVVALGVIEPATVQPGAVPGADARLAWKGRWNLPFYTDTWDGYPVAREDFYRLCREAGASDLMVLTGDSHSFWANQLVDADGNRMGVEIGTAGISSPGDFVESGFAPEIARQLDRTFERELEEVRWTDNFHQGYVRTVLGRNDASVDYVAVNTVEESTYQAFVLKSETVRRRGESIAFAS